MFPLPMKAFSLNINPAECPRIQRILMYLVQIARSPEAHFVRSPEPHISVSSRFVYLQIPRYPDISSRLLLDLTVLSLGPGAGVWSSKGFVFSCHGFGCCRKGMDTLNFLGSLMEASCRLLLKVPTILAR